MAGSFRCTVVTPDRQVLDTDATFVALPAHDGEIGILHNRAPLVCKLGIGVLRVTAGGGQQRYFVDGGFAQVLDNNLTVLTPKALSSDQIDPAAAEASFRQVAASHPTDEAGQNARQAGMQRARAQLKAVRLG
ncbi:MAG TPA: ATP synthase F1 subunit epsilon [Phycisphaerae bacterium]